MSLESSGATPGKITAAWEVVFTKTYLKAHVKRLQRTRSGFRPLFVYNFLLLAVMIGLNVRVMTMPGADFFARLLMPSLLVLLVLSQWTRPWLAARRWRKSPLLNQRCRFEINPAGMHAVDGVSEGRMKWTAFTRARHFADGWLIFFGENLAYWLPDDRLVIGSIEGADQLVRERVADHREA